jgi:Holliday junction resolvase RusA-like endonuclease
LEYCFNINPVAASRPRVGKYGAYFTGPYKTFRQEAAKEVLDVLGPDFDPIDNNLEVIVEIAVKKPKTTKFNFPRGDIDNYLKSIFDCLNGRLWVDDRLIVGVYCKKLFAEDNGYFKIMVTKTEAGE